MHLLIPVLHRPNQPTGVCRHAANLAQCLAETAEVSRITLLIGVWQQAYFNQVFNLSSPKIEVVSINIKNSSLVRNRWYLLGLPKVARQLNPDIVHLSFPFPFVRSWFTMPVVSTIHDLYPYECPQNFGYPQVWFNQAFLRWCIQASDGLACVSNVTLKKLQHYFPTAKAYKKVAAIYNAVDFNGIKSQEPHRSVCNFSLPFFATVAQHRANKNLDLLIKAYSILRDKNRLPSGTWLLIVGSEGPQTDKLVHLIDTLALADQVVFLSDLQDEELRWIYEQATLFVIPSSTEGFCLPLVEALSLDCPTVCSNIPIFREVGSSYCQYFDLDSQALPNLVEAIELSLVGSSSQPHKTNRGNARFSRPEIARQLIDFYRLFLDDAVKLIQKFDDQKPIYADAKLRKK